jgi:hypothetical protein
LKKQYGGRERLTHSTIHTGLAVSTHCEQEGPADAYGGGTQTERLDDVGRAAHTTVNEDLELAF